MKVKRVPLNIYTFNTLLKLFEYSIKDIKSYEELTDEEKKIINKKVFDYITVNDSSDVIQTSR